MKTILIIFALLINTNASAEVKNSQYYTNLYQSFISGKTDINKISKEDKQALLYMMSKNRSCSNMHGECKEACQDADEKSDELASVSEDLTRCAKNKDFTEDCSSKFINTRSAYDDYEDAVNRFEYECH